MTEVSRPSNWQGGIALAHCIIARALVEGILPSGYFDQPTRDRDHDRYVRVVYTCGYSADAEQAAAALTLAANAAGINLTA